MKTTHNYIMVDTTNSEWWEDDIAQCFSNGILVFFPNELLVDDSFVQRLTDLLDEMGVERG